VGQRTMLVMAHTGTTSINPTLYANPGYDPRKDFAPIGLMAKSQNVLLVNSSLGVASISELIARAKADLTERTRETPYVSPIPKDAKPPLDMAADAA